MKDNISKPKYISKCILTSVHNIWLYTIVLLTLASCNAEEEAREIHLSQSGFPLVQGETAQLAIMIQSDPSIEDMDTNLLTLEYEEKTNVHVKWQETPLNGALEKLNLTLASRKSLPDVFMGMPISSLTIAKFGGNGTFADLTGLINSGTLPNITAMFAYNPALQKMQTMPNGKIYSLPDYAETYHTSMSQKMWINQNWLETLGLEMPQTTEDFYNVLKAFKEGDPNGNGKADEIPLTGAISGWMTNVVAFPMSAFTYINVNSYISSNEIASSYGVEVEKGKIYAPYMRLEFREGLRYLNRLYQDGLLDKQAFIQNREQLRKLGENNDAQLLGAVTAGAVPNFLVPGSKRLFDYVTVPPLEGPEGIRTTAYRPVPEYKIGKFVVTSSAVSPELAVRWVDWFYGTEGTLRARHGIEGQHWRYASEGEVDPLGRPASYVTMELFGRTQNVAWSKVAPNFFPDKLRNYRMSINPNDLEAILLRESMQNYAPYLPDEVLLPINFTSEEGSEAIGILSEIALYIDEMIPALILGDPGKLDEGWEGMQAQLQNMGVEKMLSIMQTAYERQYQ